MQPTTLTKPVMDVAAPKSPAPAPAPVFQQPSAPQATQSVVSQTGPLPVRTAPLAAHQPMPAAPLLSSEQRQAPAAKQSVPANRTASRTPVALITVTVFVMLVLSVLAVTVYVTSQTA